MAHMSRLTLSLQALLLAQRVAALGSLNADGTPLVSMVPFAVDPRAGVLVIHVSGLAAHSANVQHRPDVSLLVMQSEAPGAPVHALERVSMQGQASVPQSASSAWHGARAAYIARFPEAQDMLQLGDFRFVTIEPGPARHVAGFGAARSVDAQELRRILTLAPDTVLGK